LNERLILFWLLLSLNPDSEAVEGLYNKNSDAFLGLKPINSAI